MADCATGTAIAQVDLTKIKPYGDTLNDGMTELAFTLPVPYGDEADEAARQLARQMGLDEPNVVYSKSMTDFMQNYRINLIRTLLFSGRRCYFNIHYRRLNITTT